MTVKVAVIDDKGVAGIGTVSVLRQLLPSDFKLLEPVTSVLAIPEDATLAVCDLHLRPAQEVGPGEFHLSGSQAIRYLIEERGLLVVATSGLLEDQFVTASMAAGARSFISTYLDPPSYVWLAALEAVGEGRHHVTAALARNLLNDAQKRPLDADDFTRESRQFLEQVLLAADGPAPQGRLDNSTLAHIHNQIWRVCGKREAKYRLEVKTYHLQAAALLAAGWTYKEVGERLFKSEKTVRAWFDHLKRDQWDKHYAGTPLEHLKPQDMAIEIYRQYAEENGLRLPRS
jgi:DNA-binding NarL/FixJ family response regulator